MSELNGNEFLLMEMNARGKMLNDDTESTDDKNCAHSPIMLDKWIQLEAKNEYAARSRSSALSRL